MLREWNFDNLKEKFKGKEICRFLCIQMYIFSNNINKIKYFSNKYIFFHSKNFKSHVFKYWWVNENCAFYLTIAGTFSTQCPALVSSKTDLQGAFQNKRDFFKIAIYSGAIFW